MDNLLRQFQKHWVQFGFAKTPTAKFLLAVSGGVDSMVLADIFLKSSITFEVAHCNFQLRSEASDGDEQFVAEWCKANNVVLHVRRFDTAIKSLEWKKGIQETARILRYEWFEALREKIGLTRIVTAHHANDNVETLLINLFKGTGINGLHGIQPGKNFLLRPLLFVTKDEIIEYAGSNNVLYREDASNNSDDYLRNTIRHNILPPIIELFPKAVESINKSIERFAEAEQLYGKAIELERKKLIEKRGQDYYIPIRKFKLRKPLASIMYELLQPFGFSALQTEQVLALLDAETGRYVSSASHRVLKNREFLIITTLMTEGADILAIEAAPCIVTTAKYRFTFAIQDNPKKFLADANVAYLNIKELTYPLLLRKWKTGDYFYPFGMKMKKKKVSRFLIDEKTPLHEKEHIWVLETKKRIAWIAGMRPDERFRVREGTEKVLVVKREEI